MKKWRWLIGGVAAAVVMLGVVGGAIMAQESEDKESRFSSFAARVASILGLEADDVEDAMEQAKQELADEALDDKLATMVESGVLTQQQADEYNAWIEAKPEGVGLPYFVPGKDGEHVAAMLATMVEKGALTQAQADEYKTWIESAPEDVTFGGKRGHHKFGSGHRGGGKRWHGWSGFKWDKDGEGYHSDGDDDGGADSS